MSRTIYALAALMLMGQPAWANPIHDRLQQMSEQDRNVYFTTVLQRSGENRDEAVKHAFQRRGNAGDAVWEVACRNKKSYSITIYNDTKGSTMITDCATLKALHADKCFK